ncbi:benzyl alcohol O-benzoyltransferase [Manihot esculenta]|uniref:Uncharacterized protein n=1 Tax=Manihot esculenta TaxID=3983 RepID=A0A2C9VI96_MANES|nr:benzyl alcohol O-benzoyltransferase [Manihot esculenta]OAY44535.1 hypothetical protein MANES_08G158600v8 [Manihot esculenta]
MSSLPASAMFKVHRRQPELLTPAKPTPHEFKPLSDIDDQESLRFHIPLLQVYRHHPSMQMKDPVKIIREALAKALVFYYPFAGRLREGHNRKLLVECTAEGILFIEADADVTLEQSGDALEPPFPCLEELLFDVPGSSEILNCPLLLVQVTRFKCGGFALALRVNHTVSDAPGFVQFMSGVAEMARGKQAPSVLPVWERHVLNARSPPRVTCIHREYDEVEDNKSTCSARIPFPLHDIVDKSFFIELSSLSTLRRFAPPHLQECSNFQILTACLWKCRTIALQPNPKQEMRMICLNNARRKFNPSILPEGYYGNGFVLSTTVATAEEITQNPIGFALKLVRKAATGMSREYLQSVADLMVIKGRPQMHEEGSYVVSDVRHAGFGEVDFGWGKAVYGGPVRAIPIIASFLVPFENKKGEKGIVIPICLPSQAMERFAKELNNLLEGIQLIHGHMSRSSHIISSL